MTNITKPIVLDETFADKADALNEAVGSLDETVAGKADALEEMLAAKMDAIHSDLGDIAIAVGASGTLDNWAAIHYAVKRGDIGKYLIVGDQLNVTMEETVYPASITGDITVAVDAETFIAHHGSNPGFFVFRYDGSVWKLDDSTVSLDTYGITVTGTPEEGNNFTIIVSAANNPFDVEGIDEEVSVRHDDDHVLSLVMHSMIWPRLFDPPQYLIAVTRELLTHLGYGNNVTALPPGTYDVQLKNATALATSGYDGTIMFTTTIPIPIGGGIRHENLGRRYGGNASDYNLNQIRTTTGNDVYFITYDADTVTELERVKSYTSDHNDYPYLGRTSARNYEYLTLADGTTHCPWINYTVRQCTGSDRWSTSYIRQLLNSPDSVLSFVPATIFSRNDSISREGFLHLIDPELRAVLTKVRKRYALYDADNAGQSGGYEDVEDYVTLDTSLDVFGLAVSNVYEGAVDSNHNLVRSTAMSLWRDSVAADRIKNINSSTRAWYLSSIYTSGSASISNISVTTATGATGSTTSCLNTRNNAGEIIINANTGIAPRIHIG